MSLEPEEQYQHIKTKRRNYGIPLLGHCKNTGSTFKSSQKSFRHDEQRDI